MASREVMPGMDAHPERVRWNAKHAADGEPSFVPRPLLERVVAAGAPSATVLELAAGASGNALALLLRGWDVTLVDVSDVALDQVHAEAIRRGLGDRLRLIQADAAAWEPPAGAYGLVLGTRFWDPATFAAACRATTPGGLLGWEAFTLDERRHRPTLRAEWCLGPGEPAVRLPAGWHVLHERDVDDGRSALRELVARRP